MCVREKKEYVSVYLQNVCMCVCIYMCAHMFHAMIGGRTIFLLLFHSDTRSAPSMSRHLELHPPPTHMVFGREAKTILSRMGADQAELKLP